MSEAEQGGEPAPAWAGFMGTAARCERFLAAVRGDLEGREAGLEVELGEGGVRVSAGDSKRAEFGLLGLAQHWHALGEAAAGAAGRALIAEHFDAIWRRLGRGEGAASPELERLDDARPRLRLRLFTERAAVRLAEGLVQRRLARGLHAVLVVDLPELVRPVEPARLRQWLEQEEALSEDALWSEARARSLEIEVSVQRLRLFDQVPVLAVTGDSFFTASRIFGLEALLDERLREQGGVPKLGALVAAPTRHTLLVHPLGVHQTAVPTALTALNKAAATLFEQGPGSLSPELYWWRAGELAHIGAGRDKLGRLVLGAPEAFMREVLGEDDEGGGPEGAGG